MSYETDESSVASSRQVELYEFVVGAAIYRYATSEDAITLDGFQFDPRPIGRDEITYGPGDGSTTVTITLPADDEFAIQNSRTTPASIPRCTIRRYQRVSGEASILFLGNVVFVEFDQNARAARVTVQSDETSGNRSTPRHRYSTRCNHQLYGPGCAVARAQFQMAGVVGTIVGNKITVAGAGSFRPLNGGAPDPDPFNGGYCYPLGVDDFRAIINQSGDELTLLYPFASLPVNAQVVLQMGCDHIFDGDCSRIFFNTPRFGGYAFVPDRNLFTKGIS